MSNRKVCFFGHSDTPWSVQPKLREVILDLIDNEEADEFYVGNHGNFDRMVLAVLSELSETRAFRFYVVLAYLPAEKEHRGNIRQTFVGRSSQVQATGRKEEQASHRTFHIKTQLTLRLFNSVVHFSTCITS